MAQESFNADPESPPLCSNNCGFFGSPATMNLCSKCYRDVVLQQQGHPFVPKEKSPMVSVLGEKGLLTMDLASAAAPTLNVQTASTSERSIEETSVSSECSSASSQTLNHGDLPVVASVASSSLKLDEPAPQKTVSRCLACRKRVGLVGFKCRCGNVFCSQHRYSDQHDCSFDYKAAARDAIAKANPLVKADKVEKI